MLKCVSRLCGKGGDGAFSDVSTRKGGSGKQSVDRPPRLRRTRLHLWEVSILEMTVRKVRRNERRWG